MKPIFRRGPSLQLRLFLAIVVAVGLIVSDNRIGALTKIRHYMDTVISPFYYVSNSPRQVLDGLSSTFATRRQLSLENRALHQELLAKKSDLLLLKQLQQENNRLRELLGSPLRQEEHKMITQVLSTAGEGYSDQIVINKGTDDGVYEGQPVISDKGVVGQIVSSAKTTSRVLLVCNPSHGLPIQVLRNDVRVVVMGAGCNDELLLEYLPNNADIRIGDVLVTSGLDGRFPEGYPVAVVSSMRQDSQKGYAVFTAVPTAELRRLRYLLLLWTTGPQGHIPATSEEVREIAKKRLLQMLPQLTLPAEPAPTQQNPAQKDNNDPQYTGQKARGEISSE